jgi:Family of unknown function (DUF6152)
MLWQRCCQTIVPIVPGEKYSLPLVYIIGQAGNSVGENPVGDLRGLEMKRALIATFTFLIFACGFSGPLLAHHSSSSYDLEHPITLKGTVTSLEWTNPHVFIHLDVKNDDGSVEPWRIEGNSPNMLSRSGWKKEMLNAGDQVTVSGAPARNKTKVMRLASITMANGQKYDGQGFK